MNSDFKNKCHFFPVFAKDASDTNVQWLKQGHRNTTQCSYSPIVPAVSDRVQTVQAGAGEVGGGRDVLGDGGGVEGEAGRPGHWTATMGRDRASVNAAQNKSEGPDRAREKRKQDLI